MSLNNTFRDIALDVAPKQPELIDYTIQEAPILAMTPFQSTSNGMEHVWEETVSATGNGLVDLDAPLPSLSKVSELRRTTLDVLGGQIEVGEDKAKLFGGRDRYIANQLPAILKQTGRDTETSILYNTLRAQAIAAASNDRLADKADHKLSAGGSGSTNYSIIAVKWEPGAVQGLYNPDGFGNGLLFDMEAINGGNLYKNSDGVLVYGMRLKSYFGMLTANPQNLATIVNIDLANDKLPTEAQLDDLVNAVRGQSGGSTFLYMHPKVHTALNAYKGSALQTTVATRDYDRTFEAWNGIPIITSYNFLNGSEATVS